MIIQKYSIWGGSKEVLKLNNYHKATLDKKTTGLLLRKAITDSSMTIEEISIKLELSTSRVIYSWMNGEKLPNLENLVNLSLMLNTKLEDLVAWR